MKLLQPVSAPLKILVVDDMAFSRMYLASMLRALGYQVEEASEGQAALLKFIEQQPDLVLMDLLMPGMDGFEATRHIKALSPERWVPVIAVSGLEGEEHLLAALEAGADDFLSRPVHKPVLITKLKNIARVLTLQQQNAQLLTQFRAMSENVLDALLVFNQRGTIMDANLASELLFRADRSELIGKSIHLLLPGALITLLKGDPSVPPMPEEISLQRTREITAVRGNGQFFPAEVGISIFMQGSSQMFLATLRDCSERHRLDQLKRDFISSVSHELRTPLTSIIGSLRILQSNKAGPLNEKNQRLADLAYENSQRLQRLINDILDLNRAEAASIPLQIAWHALPQLLEAAVNAHQGYADLHQVQLSLTPRALALQHGLLIDHGRWLQIMGNLLSNAIKYSPAGGSVSIDAELAEGKVRIDVIDQGPGIPPDFQPRVFQPFAQADSSDRRGNSGSGLGLSITQRLVRLLGGDIGFQTSAESGTRFWLRFPVYEAPQ